MEKQPFVSTVPVEDESSQSIPDSHQNEHHWQPGYLKMFPLTGSAALAGVVICAIAAAGVLIGSDGKSTVYWPQRYAPNVALSAITSVANLLLGMAVVEGIAVSWWRKALHGATVEELHRSWLFSARSSSYFYHFFQLNKIAVAALATKIAIADGIFLQRATSTFVASDSPRSILTNGLAATEFPTTGFVVDAKSFAAQTSCDCYMIGDSYTPAVNTWETSNGFFQGYNELFTPCNGVCFSHIEAIGFEVDCQQSRDTRDLASAALEAWQADHGPSANSSQWTNIPIFNSSFSIAYPDDTANYTRMELNLGYFQSTNPFAPSSASCPGTYTTVQCQLRPAIVSYPVKVTNHNNLHVINGVSLGQITDPSANETTSGQNTGLESYVAEYDFNRKQQEGFEVIRYVDPHESQELGATTSLGGIANALSQYLSSSASITYTGSEIWALRQQGTLAQTMMYGPPNMGSCDCSFKSNSLSTVVNGINQLMFLTATGMIDRKSYNQTGQGVGPGTTARVWGITNNTAINATFTQLQTLQVADVTHYRTHYLFMGLGLATMMLCVALVLPTFWGYGQIGRKVTLGPMEIAHAFGSPVLARNRHGHVVVDGDIDNLVKAVGERRVRYGFVDAGDGMSVVDDGAPSPNIGRIVSTGRHPNPYKPTSPTTPTSPGANRRSVVLRMDDPERVSPAVGKSSASFSPVTSPRSESGKTWS